MIASMSQAAPHMCTGTTALVRGPIAASKRVRDRCVIDSSTSTITGIAPTASTEVAVAM